ncbi:hypothetical protein [Mucilaginibacter sp.]
MKNTFKVTALALVVSLSVAACSGNKKGGSGDSTADSSKKVDSTKVVKDTLKNDTTIKNDSTHKDTTVKVVTKTTETKKK